MEIELLNFRNSILTYNDFQGGQFEKPQNVWCLCRMPLFPKTTRFARQDVENIPATPSMDAPVSLLYAVSPTGKKTPPVFLIERETFDARWFYPLDPEKYSNEDGPHDFTTCKWLPRDAKPMCVQGPLLTDAELEQVFQHWKKFINRQIGDAEWILMLIPDGFSSKVRFMFSICI